MKNLKPISQAQISGKKMRRKLKKWVKKYPNDTVLGSKVRMYFYEKCKCKCKY